MVLTKEENEILTRVGPGTPGGELLRRYWMPVAVAAELTPEEPTRFVRLLGEDLVLFRDTTGRVGLLADRCAHRGASLCYGRVEERGISCPYHGWLYDTDGKILETPPERNEAIMRTVRQPSYPVRKYVGLYWAYLGPTPIPELPPYDTLVRRDGKRKLSFTRCSTATGSRRWRTRSTRPTCRSCIKSSSDAVASPSTPRAGSSTTSRTPTST
jgi:5,5'-dehydrodivanillate O-demethylase